MTVSEVDSREDLLNHPLVFVEKHFLIFLNTPPEVPLVQVAGLLGGVIGVRPSLQKIQQLGARNFLLTFRKSDLTPSITQSIKLTAKQDKTVVTSAIVYSRPLNPAEKAMAAHSYRLWLGDVKQYMRSEWVKEKPLSL